MASKRSTRKSKPEPRPRRAPPATQKAINLALQGGGSHGAFTWGVLDRLLEDGRIAFDGICGTSAGALNAVLLAHGLKHGGRDSARQGLHDFWRKVSRLGEMISPVRPMMAGNSIPGMDPYAGVALTHWLFESFTRVFSPYHFNPLNLNPLRDLLLESVDFDALSSCEEVKVFLCATNVRTGKVRVFDNVATTVDAVMASACLPHLFQAVEIDGEHYWDGGYMGNPVLFPLFYHTQSSDLVIVMVNPIRRDKLPTTPVEIADRVSEISFNSSLMREMRAVEFVGRMLHEGWLKPEYSQKMRHVLVHIIRADAVMATLPASTKFSAEWTFLTHLRDRGRATADEWLRDHFDDLGERNTVDIRREFLD